MADDLTNLPAGVRLRPATPKDRDLLLGLYESTRADELTPVPWTDAEKADFIAMQYDAQDAAYRGAYPEGNFLIVECDGQPAGRLYVAELAGEVRLIDVIVAPAQRGRGIGTALAKSVIARADRAAKPVTLHVEPWNPAKRLYERLGFETVELRGIYEFMRRPAQAQLTTAS